MDGWMFVVSFFALAFFFIALFSALEEAAKGEKITPYAVLMMICGSVVFWCVVEWMIEHG